MVVVVLWLGLAWMICNILINLDDHNGRIRINSDIYRNILSSNFERNASNLIRRKFIMQQDDDPKHIGNTTNDFIREKSRRLETGQVNHWTWTQSSIAPPEEEHEWRTFTKQRTTKRSLKKKSSTKEEHNSFVTSLDHQLDARFASKQYAPKYYMLITSINLKPFSLTLFLNETFVACHIMRHVLKFFNTSWYTYQEMKAELLSCSFPLIWS